MTFSTKQIELQNKVYIIFSPYLCTRNNQNEQQIMKKREFSRRDFLKTLGIAGATMAIQPTINKVKAANEVLTGKKASTARKNGMEHRTLGTGRAAMDVSALGFGVMGMTYNRSQHPEKRSA